MYMRDLWIIWYVITVYNTLYNAFIWKQENLSLGTTHVLLKCSSSKFHETLDIYVISKIRVSKVTYNKRMEAEIHVVINWTLSGPCFVIYSYNKSQRDALFLNFNSIKNSTCFGQIYCPSSGVLILYSQQWVFVILVMPTLADSQHN